MKSSGSKLKSVTKSLGLGAVNVIPSVKMAKEVKKSTARSFPGQIQFLPKPSPPPESYLHMASEFEKQRQGMPSDIII